MNFCPDYYKTLHAAFNRCAAATHLDTEGVVLLQGDAPGKTAGITVCTHGDEPVGLSLLCGETAWLKPERGNLFIVLNNLSATKHFFEGSQSARYLERNMNRLPNDLNQCTAIETKRAKQLAPIWQQFTAGALDIHSTSTNCPPLLIARENIQHPHYQYLPVTACISGLIDHFNGQPAIDFYEATAPRAIIECGQHHDKNAPMFLKQCIEQWLFNIGLKTKPPSIANKHPDHYHVFQAVSLPDTGEIFSYITPILPFQKIDAGQPIAQGSNGTVITSPATGYAIMAPAAGKPLPVKEEFFFLTQKRS